MEKNYEISEEQCLRRNELPRLIQRSLNVHVSCDPILKNILPQGFEETRPQYPKNHKKTLIDLRKELNILDFNKNLRNRTKEELITMYKEDPYLYSSVLLDMCNSCVRNPQCENYQVYQRNIQDSVAD